MRKSLYYTPPSAIIFEEVKEKAMRIWATYDDTHGYATEKIARINDLENTGDNFMYMVAMFDRSNQEKLAASLTTASFNAVAARIADGAK